MARKNAVAPAPEQMKTVRVIEEHSYIKEVPVDETPVVIPIEEEPAPDIFSTFNEIVTTNQNAILRIWLLPNYHIDGRSSTTGTDREYAGSVPYNSDNAVLLDQISGRVPQGGMVQLELFNDGAIRKRGLLKLMKSNVTPSAAYTPQQGTHLVINQPPTPQAAAMNPAEVMREHMTLAKDLVQMARDLQPPAATIIASNGDEPRPFEERLFETILSKAVETDTKGDRIDRVLDAFSGARHKEPGIMEGVLEIIKAFAPTIDKVVQQMLATQQAQQRAMGAQSVQTVQPPQLSGASSETLPEGTGGQGEAPQVIDPIARDWFQVIIRMLEDCTRHVELAGVGGGGKSVLPSAEAVIELAERYPVELGPTINQLLSASPEQVLDLCSIMLDEQGKAHVEARLKSFPAAGEWIALLQEECKRIIEDARQDATGENDTAPTAA